MALARKLFVNWHTRRRQKNDLSASLDTVSRMGFLKGEIYPFEVVIVEPNPAGGVNSFQRVDITNLSLNMMINDSLFTATPKAQQTSWSKDTSRNVFSGSLSLNTAAMNTYIDGTKTAYFELEIVDGTNRVKVLSEECDLALGVGQVTTSSPDPAREYYTKDEMVGVFVQRVMGPGETITWRDANGVTYRIFGVRTDGTPQDDAIA